MYKYIHLTVEASEEYFETSFFFSGGGVPRNSIMDIHWQTEIGWL